MTPLRFSRRSLLQLAAIAPACRPLLAQTAGNPAKKSAVALVRGESRRRNIAEALAAIDGDIRPVLRTKKYVAIKVNNVSVTNQLAASHADAIHGILDYLEPREREIIRMRAGLDSGAEGMTLEKIGEKLGITKERVRQLNVRAMKKLRTIVETNKDEN